VSIAGFDSEFALVEYREMRAAVSTLVVQITQTERFAVLGAAGTAAFSVSGFGDELAGGRMFVSALPFVIVSLAGLRCLTLYLVLHRTLHFIEQVENALLQTPALGFQRHFGRDGERIQRYVEVISGGYWLLAVAASAIFWLLVN
jgi:hypothetical protein